MRFTYFILVYLFFLTSFLACKNADKNTATINTNEQVFLSVQISNNNSLIANSKNSKLTMKGSYYNCVGHANAEEWEVSNSSTMKSNSLYYKKNDKECVLFLQSAELVITYLSTNKIEKFNFTADDDIKVTDKYEGKNLKFISDKDTYYFDIKIDSINNSLNLFIIGKSNFLSKDKFFNSEKIVLEVIPTDQKNININHFKISHFNFKNAGTVPVSITSFNNDFVFQDNCMKKILEIGDVCSASFLLSHSSITERKFSLAVNYKFNHPDADIKTTQSSHTLGNDYKKEIFTQAQFFKNFSIYRTFSYGNLLFVAVNTQERESLYLSENGVYGPFKIVEGIPHGIEIRGLKVFRDKIYVIAYKINERINYGGLYVANLNYSPSKFRNIMANSTDRIQDFLSIANNAKNLYVATKGNGIFTVDYKTDILKKISISDAQIEIKNFHEIFVYKDNIFAVYENNVYFARENDLKFSKIKVNILTNEIKSLFVYKNKILLGTNSGLYYSKLTASADNFLEVLQGGFIQDNSFKNNDIYDMKLFGNSLYIATICFVTGCSKSDGIYYKNLDSETSFSKIFSPDFSDLSKTKYMGIFVSNNDIIASTSNGFQYLNLFYPTAVDIDNVKKVFKSNKNMYLIKNGFDDGIYISQDLTITGFKKRKMNLNTDGIISVQDVGNYLCILIKNNNVNRGFWCAENTEILEFKKVNEFSNFEMIGMEAKNNVIYLYAKNYIFYAEKNENSIKVKNYIKFSSDSEYNSASREEIRGMYFEKDLIILLTTSNIYFSRLNKENLSSEIKLKFKKIIININLNYGEEIKSFYKYNNYILLGTSRGLFAAVNGMNGNFKNIYNMSSGPVESIFGFGNYAYIVANNKLNLIGLNEDLSEGYYNKFSNKVIRLFYDNYNYYYLSSFSFAKNNKINQFSNYTVLSNIQNDKFIDGVLFNKKIYVLSEKYIYVKNERTDNLEFMQENSLSFSKIFEFNQELYLLNKNGLYKFIPGKISKVSDLKMDNVITNFDEAFFIKNNEIYYTNDFLFASKIDLKIDKNFSKENLYFTHKYLYFTANNSLFLYNRESKELRTILSMKDIRDIKIVGDSLFVITKDEFLVSKDYGSSFTLLRNKEKEADFEKINFAIADNYLNVFTYIQTVDGFVVSSYY